MYDVLAMFLYELSIPIVGLDGSKNFDDGENIEGKVASNLRYP